MRKLLSNPSLLQPRPGVAWGPVAAIIGTIAIYFGAQLITGVLIAIYAAIVGWDVAQIGRWIDDSIYAQFLLITLPQVLTVVLLLWFLRNRKSTLGDVGLKNPKLVQDVGAALVGYGIYLVALTVILVLVQAFAPFVNVDQAQELGFSTSQTGIGLLLAFISFVIVPPIAEEIIMRGFLFTGLRTKLNFWWAALVTSILFGIAHLQFGSDNPLLWVAAIDTFILSLVLVSLKEKTGRLWAPIGLHAVKNLVAFLGLFVFGIL